jgi:hypothetical protein
LITELKFAETPFTKKPALELHIVLVKVLGEISTAQAFFLAHVETITRGDNGTSNMAAAVLMEGLRLVLFLRALRRLMPYLSSWSDFVVRGIEAA